MADSEDLLQAEQQLALSQCLPFGFGVHCTLAILAVHWFCHTAANH